MWISRKHPQDTGWSSRFMALEVSSGDTTLPSTQVLRWPLGSPQHQAIHDGIQHIHLSTTNLGSRSHGIRWPMWMAQKSHGYRMLNHVKSFFGRVRSPFFGCLNIWHRLELCFNTYDKKCSKWLCLLLKIQMAVPMFPSVFVYLLSSFLLRSKFPIFAESKSYVCCFFPRCSPIFPTDSRTWDFPQSFPES